MRISDWSSDVCSSDLDHRNLAASRHDTALVGGIITVNKPLHIGYECPVGFIVTKEDFLDEPPVSADLTAYDQAHLKLYMRLLDAEADGVAWEEVVQVLFGLDPAADAIRAAKINAAHLTTAKGMTATATWHLLRQRYT